MPDNKKTTKNTGSKKTVKNNTTSKKTNSAEKRTQKSVSPKKDNTVMRQIAPYILAAAAVLLGVCVIFGEGKVGGGLRDIFTGLFAGGAYVLPVLMLVRTFLWNRDSEEGQLTSRSVCLGVEFVFVTMFLHAVGGGQNTLSLKTHFSDGVNLVGGGVFGGLFGELLLMGFGKVCTIIIIVAVLVLLGLFIAGITPKTVFIFIAYKIRFAGEKRREKRQLSEEKRRNAQPTRAKIREEEYLAYLREKKQRDRDAKKAQSEERKNPARSGEPGEQIPMPAPQATVYRVRKRRIADLDIPVSGTIDEENTAEAVSEEDTVSAAEVKAALEDTSVDSSAVDEKIFDEVMRRTRERIEKSRKTEDMRESVPEGRRSYVPAGREMQAERKPVEILTPADDFSADESMPSEVKAGDVLDAVEIASLSIHEKTKMTSGSADYEISGNASAFDFDEPDPCAGGYEPERDDMTNEEPSYGYASDVPESEEDDDEPPFDMSEGIVKGMPEKKPAKPKKADDETDTVKLATSADDSGFDMTKIFVNPADAELIDKLSEQYRQPLEVQRTVVSAPAQAPVKPAKPSIPPYQFPPTDILAEDPGSGNEDIKDELQENAVKLVETLRSFNVKTKIVDISRGPTITRYELMPEPGVRVRSVQNLVDDIALNLATTGVRIEAPIPGKAAVGIEVPNKKQTTVHLRKLLEDPRFTGAKSQLTVALGEDVAGEAVYFDIGKMPHLLIAGATGAGKSVCINSVITSLLYKASPEDVKLILIDPKKVELSIYNGIPHLLVPVISEPKKAAGSLSWAVGEMERRYGLLESVGVRDIKGFNELTKNDPDYEYMPRIVIVIDELADLMMTASDDVEDSICRIAQKARAAGMHLIIGTQRPSVDVITGLIKANVPSRIAFRTSSQIDSRTIIDVGHAANLIGMGDMLFNPVGALKPRRVQGAYVSESDVEEVVAYIKNMNSAYDNFDQEKIVNEIEREAQKCGVVSGKGKAAAASADDDGDEEDPMLKSAVELAIDSGKISTSLIQRRLSLGYGRAAKLIDRMEQLGFVSAPDGSKPREVLITKAEYMEMRLKDEAPFDD